jgi:hypothetical protein
MIKIIIRKVIDNVIETEVFEDNELIFLAEIPQDIFMKMIERDGSMFSYSIKMS